MFILANCIPVYTEIWFKIFVAVATVKCNHEN